MSNIRPLPPITVPIAGINQPTDPWQRYLASLDQAVRANSTFPGADAGGPDVSVANAAGVTLTAPQLLAGVLLRSGPAGAFSDATPSAAEILAQIVKANIGDNRLIMIRNAGGGMMTLTAGTGVTLRGTTTVASGFSRFYLVKVTAIGDSAAVDLRGLLTGAM